MSVKSVTLDIISHVSPEKRYLPLTGTFSVEESIPGWKWDVRTAESVDVPSSRGGSWLGGHDVGLKDGTREEQWQSGTVEGLEFQEVVEKRRGDFLTWTPTVATGRYSTYFDLRTLYSDFSISERVDPLLNRNGRNTHKLRSDALETTVSVVLYERDAELVRKPKISAEMVEEFSGVISGTQRLSTVDGDGNIIWANVADRKSEFLIKDGEVLLNDAYEIKVGDFTGTLDKAAFDAFYEHKGAGTYAGRLLFSNYFPMADKSVSVYTIDGAGTIREWSEVVNLNFSKPTDLHYSVDYDLGIVKMGGYSAPDLVLYSAVDLDDTIIKVHLDTDVMASYPDQGVIQIGTEKILYYGKGRDAFYDCIRGHDGTTAQEHAALTKVEDVQHGEGVLVSEQIYIGYTAVPRVEYEVTTHDVRTANASNYLNVKAVANVEANNIVQISTVEPNLAEVKLEIDRNLIGGSLYGPAFYGTDVAKLTATGLDSRGNPVEDTELHIVLNEETGSLNGSLQEYSALSNSLGQIYAFYNSPYDEESISKKVTNVTVGGGNTTLTLDEPIPADTKTSSITTYQILKHDGVFGTTGLKLTATTGENDPVFTDDPTKVIAPCVVGTTAYFEDAVSRFDNAIAYVEVDEGSSNIVRYRRKVIGVIDHFETDAAEPIGSQDERGDLVKISFLLDYQIPSLATGTVVSISLIQQSPSITPKFDLLPSGEQEWNSVFLDGVKVVLYEWQEDIGQQTIYHPITNEVGAYYPIRPSSVTPTTITFAGRSLPIPAPTDNDNNLGGYVVVAPTVVSFYAWGKDPVTGRIIKSDTIKLKLVLPAYLDGVKDPDGGLPVPYGFSFVTEDFNVGAGLGGANFITINSAKAPLYIDATPPISNTGANLLPINLKVGL